MHPTSSVENVPNPLGLLVELVFVGDWQISLPLEGGGPLAVEGVLVSNTTKRPDKQQFIELFKKHHLISHNRRFYLHANVLRNYYPHFTPI